MENLKKNKISELSQEQIESRIQYLLTLSDDKIINYLLYLFDNEYSKSNEIDEKVENFISDVRFKKFRNSILENIKWFKKDDMYFSDQKYEFTIYKKGRFWILSYTDFWTSDIGESFFVNIKNSSDEFFAVPALKRYANSIIENRKLNKI